MPYRIKAAEILARWREVERQFDAAPEADIRISLQIEMDRLRREYQVVFEEARAKNMPEPPAFPAGRPAATA